MAGPAKAIRVLQANNQPIIVDTRIGKGLVTASTYDQDTLLRHAQRIREEEDFRERVTEALTRWRPEREPSAYAEERIYHGFPNRIDENLMRQFHAADQGEKVSLIGRLLDERFAELGLKLLYAEMPHAMPEDARREMDRHFAERLLTDGKVPWLTIPAALAELAERRAAGARPDHLSEIEAYLNEMRAIFASRLDP